MPLFEFRCGSCDAVFEELVRGSQKVNCPSCESKQVEKLMSASAGRVAGGSALPITGSCPPPEAGPCGTGCCRLP